jgi:hypothetical protein
VLKAKVPPELIASVTPLIPPIDPEIPDIPGLPEPPLPAVEAGSAGGKPELTLAERVELYSGPTRGKFLRANVEPSRFAFNEVQALTTKAAIDIGAVDEISAALQKFDLNLDDLVLQVEDTTGNINFEELVDVGLDGNRDKIVATYMVKKASGFSGGLCTAGSLEYVAFWADWNDTCDWEYLDTVKVRAYDFDELPDGGLCYSAALPVDLDEFKRKCQDPKVARIRAVLSWNSPPSTTDPDQLPTWGNRLDAHALVPRLEGSPGLMSVIGGLSVFYIDDTTGMATPTAKFTDTGTTVYSPSGDTVPFGGLIVVRGPAVANKRYRIQVIDSDGDSQTLTEKIWISPSNGGAGSYHTGTADGWFDYKQYAANFSSVLGYYRSNQNDKVTIQLEIEGDGVVDTQAVQLDNIRPDVAVTITAPGTDCGLFESGVVMEGLVDATDVHMGAWRVEIDGGPAGFGPVVVATGDADTAPGGTAWKYSTKGLLQCGYIVRVVASDRAIVGSGNSQHHRSADVGFCILT